MGRRPQADKDVGARQTGHGCGERPAFLVTRRRPSMLDEQTLLCTAARECHVEPSVRLAEHYVLYMADHFRAGTGGDEHGSKS